MHQECCSINLFAYSAKPQTHSVFPQKYAWGKVGDTSVVASLKSAGDKTYAVKKDETYAEMWIGTHPSGPCHLMTLSGNLGPLLKVRLTVLDSRQSQRHCMRVSR